MSRDNKIVGLVRDKMFWHKTVLCLLGVAVWLFMTHVCFVQTVEAKLASIGGTTSCATSGCHVVNTGSAVDQVAVKAGAASWVTYSNTLAAGPINNIPAGSTIELEWVWTNLNDKRGNTGAAIAVPNTTPSAWTFTPNTNAGAGGLTLWNATYQSTTWFGGGTPTALTANTPATHTGYATDYSTTPIANLNTTGLAIDDPGPDGTADRMGAKVSVTIPGNTPTGSYTIEVYGSGHVGNSRTSKISTITLGVLGAADATNPTVDSFSATSPVVTNVDIPITAFTASDNVGVSGYMITESSTAPGSADAGWSGTAPTLYTSAAGDGTKTLYPWAKDAAGNVSNVYGSPANVLVDGTAPTTTDNAPAGWQTINPTVTLSPSDGGSGVAGTEYCIDTNDTCTPGTAGTSATTTIGAGAAGTQYIRYRSTDSAGNVEIIQSTGAIQVDRALPGTTDNAPAGWQAADATVTLTPTDTGSGVADTQYCIDTADTCTPSVSGTSANVTQGAGTAGTQYVRYRSSDTAGNVEAIQSSGAVQIDKSSPADGSLIVTPGSTVNGLSWTTASDVGSGLRTGSIYDVRFLTGGTAPTCATGTSIYTGDNLTYNHTGLSNGIQYSYRVCAYDNVDNVSTGAIGSGTPVAGNSSPNLPTNLAQYKNDGTTAIASGGYTNEITIKIEADISDPDGGDTVKLQVDTDGDNASDCESVFAATPQTNVQVSCSVTNGTSYDWQVRSVDNSSATSAWIAFAGTPDFTVDTSAPSVTTTSPADTDTGVALDSNVTINFANGPIDCATVDTANITSDSPGWTFSSCGATQAVFTTSGQANNTTYNVNVTTAVADQAGNALSAAYPFSYTTASLANQAPTDITLSPDKVTDGTDTSGGFDIALGAVDVDGGETFNFSKTGLGADQAVFSVTGNTLTLTDGVVSYDTPGDANTDRVYEVEIQVEDSATNTYTETLRVTITPAYNPMIHSSLSTGSTKWGGDWGTATGKYGEFSCNTCHERGSGNIKRIKTSIAAPNGSDLFPIEVAAGTVSFLDTRDGTSDFGDDAGGHASSNRICEGCHSQNKYHNYNTANNSDGFNHENQKDCIACHNHSKGFGASCDTCHGNPPVTANLDSTGLVFEPSTTDATNPASPGAHELHAVTEGMSCVTCHKGNNMPTVSMTVQMGFEATNGSWSQFVGSTSGGNLAAPNEAGGQMSASYEFVSSDGGATTITKVANNDLNCTVYCHGSWTGSGGSNTTPSWVGGSGEVVCGTCHGAAPGNPPPAGSHTTHASSGGLNLACTKCHPTVSDQTHIDGSVAWDLATTDPLFGGAAIYSSNSNGSTGAVAPSGSYDQCDNVYCHSNVQGQLDPVQTPDYQTPTWGSAIASRCKACHKGGVHPADFGTDPPVSSGSHSEHVEYTFGSSSAKVISCQACHWLGEALACTPCHTAHAPEDYVRLDKHVDGAIDVDFNPAASGASGTYTGDNLPQTAYGTCENTYCHGNYGVANSGLNATPTWGTSTSGDCGTCHIADQLSATPLESGTHRRHTELGDYRIPCTTCHESVVGGTGPSSFTVADKTKHVNMQVDWNFDTSSSYNLIASSAYSVATGTVPPSDGTGRAYGSCSDIYCHSIGQTASGGPLTPGNTAQYLTTPVWGSGAISCGGCHATGALGHGEAPTDPRIISGSHDIHNQYGFRLSDTDRLYRCALCHMSGSLAITDPNAPNCATCHSGYPNLVGGLVPHADGSVDINFEPTMSGPAASYAGTPAPGDGFSSCSNTYCHSNGTSVATATIPAQTSTDWNSGTLGCSDCHDGPATGPTYTNGTPKANSHSAHASYDCVKCHSATVDASNAIIDKTVHVNLAYDISGADISSYTFDPAGGTCNSISCHFNNSAQWGGTLGCADCHGNPPNTNAHLTHAGSGAGEYGLACSICHPEDHDGTVADITFTGIAATWGSESYSGSTDKQCSNLYCHGGVTADWDAGTGGACGDCHGDANGRPDSANEPSGGSHLTTSHQVACTNCHSHDGTNTTEHVNGNTGHTTGDALVSSAGSNITNYTYGSTLASSPDPDGYEYSGGTCATSCHSDGVWGGSGGCTFCHGGSDLYYPQTSTAPDRIAEHAAHIYALETKLGYTHGTTVDAEQQVMCAYCHNDSNGVGGTGHNDGGTAEVGDFNPMWNGATADTDGVLDAGKSCSNIDCHYSTTTADTWYGTGDADCAYCHADGVAAYAAASLPDVHDKHVDETADSGYNMSCAICHDSSGYAQDHANGSSGADVTFTGAVATQWGTESYSGVAQKQCSNLYCHGGATADWDAGTGGACGDCHGDANGRPDGTDEPSGGSHLTASHQVVCTTCHSHDGTDEIEHVNGDVGHTSGDALVSSAGSSITSYTYGSTLASSPDPDGYKYSGGTCANSCHGTLDWGGTASCETCHNGSGSGYSKVSVSSPHSNTATGMTCEGCHFNDHGSRTTGTVGITWSAQTMGTDYTVDGKIYIKANGATTEAEACWACHETQTPDVSEWDGSSATYDYGSVTTGDLNWFTTSWSSANFSYKNGVLTNALGGSASTHGTMGGAAGVDQESEVSCTRCHDVHAIGNNGYTAGSAPYLRGTWKSSPYYEDGAPGRYTGSGGSGTSTYVNAGNYGVVPRASNSTANGMGGYWIDQNSGSPANGTYATHAGLCTLCHGDGNTVAAEATDVTAIETLWVGHKNTVAGGNDDGSAARNIFSTSIRIGDGVWNSNGGGLYMGAQNMVTPRNTKPYAGSIRNADYGDGVSPTVVGKALAFNNFAWAVNVDSSSVDANFHSFTCSKCHNPHASRLPKLMITNCLDTTQNSWDNTFTGDGNWGNNNYSSQTYGTNELSKSSTAQNCHRYITGQETTGWNSVTPW
jgi:predicted CxxxxCH...CXXCH cytochrome family protein